MNGGVIPSVGHHLSGELRVETERLIREAHRSGSSAALALAANEIVRLRQALQEALAGRAAQLPLERFAALFDAAAGHVPPVHRDGNGSEVDS